MTYTLEQYEISLLQVINCHLDSLYNDEIAQELRQNLLQAISIGSIEEEQIRRLYELLPQFETHEIVEPESEEVDEEFHTEWPDWKEDTEARLKRKILYLHHHLSAKLLIQYAVYQKQLMNKEAKGINKVLDSIQRIDH